ncbi:MAG TPA: DUF2442 domain-containing protein [Gammaproteobacteria bacterium]|nr:DUF2442 domain-containing protein [Gammaproteobacteria bacterium]
MTTLAIELEIPGAENVTVTDDTLSVDLSDGRTISVPTAWYPRLSHAEQKERENWKLIGGGHGIHWEDIDEDISVEGLLAGKSSGESQQSFKKWLKARESRIARHPT